MVMAVGRKGKKVVHLHSDWNWKSAVYEIKKKGGNYSTLWCSSADIPTWSIQEPLSWTAQNNSESFK